MNIFLWIACLSLGFGLMGSKTFASCKLIDIAVAESTTISPKPKTVNENKRKEWINMQPEKYRATLEKLTHREMRLSHMQLLDGLHRSVDRISEILRDEEVVYFLNPFKGKSNSWIFKLISEYLSQNNSSFRAKIQVIDLVELYSNGHIKHVIYADDAAYTGIQASQTIPGASKGLTVHYLIPFVSEIAISRIKSTLNGYEVDFGFNSVIPSVSEIKGLDSSVMTELFGPSWEDKFLSYSDHTIPDKESILTIGNTEEGNLLLGPIIGIDRDGKAYFTGRHLPFIENVQQKPY